MCRTAPLTSKSCILYIYSTSTGTEYFKHALYFPFFSHRNAVCFIMLTCLVAVLFTFYIQDVPNLKKKFGAKGLMNNVWKIRQQWTGIINFEDFVPYCVWGWSEGREKNMRVLDDSLIAVQKDTCACPEPE